MVAVPEGYESLLERPLYGHLATVRPDGSPQVNAMWFAWDGERLRFTHTVKRQKYRNIAANPRTWEMVSRKMRAVKSSSARRRSSSSSSRRLRCSRARSSRSR